MKKMMLLGLSICGMTTLASAWTARYPQFVTVGGGTTTFSCKSQEQATCMSGSGTTPKVGQDCIIHHHGQQIPGKVVSVQTTSNDQTPEPVLVEVTAVTEVAVQVAN